MTVRKISLLTLFLYSTSATAALPEDKEYFNIDNDREKISIIVHSFVINTTDVIYKDVIISEIADERLENVTISGLKNCTGKHVFFEVGWVDTTDMTLNFTLECQRLVVQYKCKNCSYDVDENEFKKGEFNCRNDVTQVVADIGHYQDILDKTHMTAKYVTLSYGDDERPTKNSSFEARFKEPVFSAFLKKADLVSKLFF